MKFVTYNIQYGLGQDGENDLDRICDEVAGADVIALQEVERFWPRSGNIDQAAAIAIRLRDYFWVYGAGVDLHIDAPADANPADAWRANSAAETPKNSPRVDSSNPTPQNSSPNTSRNTRRQFGNMLLCRRPILSTRCHLLPQYGTQCNVWQRAALEAVTQCGGRRLRLYSLHLTHLSSVTRRPQIESLLALHAHAGRAGAPVCGDLRGTD